VSDAAMTHIPQTSPQEGYLAHRDEIDSAVNRVLQSGWYVLGQEVEQFENEFSRWIGTEYALGVASGTDAIELALRALDIGSSDLVLTVSHTAVATAASIVRCGATPVFVDVDSETYTMDPVKLEKTITEMLQHPPFPGARAKAIVPVHLFGHPADMRTILDIAQRYELAVIEDCAQAHGAQIQGQKVGTLGHISAFSFYPTKNLGALGDGGAVLTNSRQIHEKLHALRQYGWEERNVSTMHGINSRLDEIQAAILRAKLNHLEEENENRREIAALYNEGLKNAGFVLPVESDGNNHVYHQYVIRAERRDDLMAYLKKQSIGSAIHYPKPVHEQPAFLTGGICGSSGLDITEEHSRRILSLPMFPQLTPDQARRVVQALLSGNVV